MAETAFVHIIDVPYHADKPYEYYIPGEMRDSVQPGVLVEVPFGGGNRKMSAVVNSLNETATVEMTLKPIQSVLSEGPLLSSEMMDLCAFVKEYTLCTFGDAVRAAVPSAALSKIKVHYITGDRTLDCEDEATAEADKMGREEGALFRFICEKPRSSKIKISDAFDFDVGRPLQKLEKAGLVRKEYEIKGQAGIRQRAVADIVRGMPMDSAVRLRSERHQRVLAYLMEHGPSDFDEISFGCDLTRAAVKSTAEALRGKGMVTVSTEEVYRNYFTSEHFSRPPSEADAAPMVDSLSEEQRAAYNTITELYESGSPKAALLHGVTGSGKTSVIMAAIERVLGDGRGVIMLIPEIALTPQTVGVFIRRFGDRIAVIHSGLSAGERFDAWRRIRDGKADVVIGTRSAVFAPVNRLGMIIIDEEHEYTYKSDTAPKYHAHDVARFRCREHNAVMLLSSATPSVSSYYKAKSGVYTLIELKNRYGGAVLPEVVICDMRGSGELISGVLADRLAEDRKNGNQAILFLNRRGYNNYVSCRTCGKSIKCPHCSVTMTYHMRRNAPKGREADDAARRNNGYLACHMCGYRTNVPEKCPHCGKEHFLFMGCGTQKAEDDIAEEFRDFRVIRMDLDTTQGKHSHEELLGKFRNGKADILLGTQMVTKGHDFPKVSTVGVLNADSSLMMDDYRAAERTFAMLTQVIGRAGRGEVPGCAVIQTWNPDNEVLALAARQDYISFYEGEIRIRKGLCFPPFCDIAVITLSSSDENHLNVVTLRMREQIMMHINEDYGDVPLVVYGPFEAPVYRVQNVYRMRFVIKCRLNKRTRAFISQLMGEFSRASADKRTGKSARLTVSVDLNPTTV
ncbi:MAG: primosomal protein N' [Ruminococcaceae bacterium]|nr:primosomal protein N' [Oscillospiraceae bacterium]